MNGVMCVYEYKRWGRKSHLSSRRQLFMGAWGRGGKTNSRIWGPRAFIFIYNF